MCGIVGYLGERNPTHVILNGLKRLEYRGYDSAGIAVLENGKIESVRAEGKLVHLEQKLKDRKFSGHLGIGHTRWATHGAPVERNAHPHTVNGVSLVHNGIIENYLEIRADLLKEGAQIASDTDSELVAHLIAREVSKTQDLLKAVQIVLPKLSGAYSVLVVWEKQPDTMVAFKSGPPLVVGIGKDEMIVASDVQAVIEWTDRVIYLEDDQLVCVKGNKAEVYNAENKVVPHKVVQVDWSSEKAEKNGFAHFMAKEIFEQPRAIANALSAHVDVASRTLNFDSCDFQMSSSSGVPEGLRSAHNVFRETTRIYIVSCGTSYYAGCVGEYLIEKLARIPVEVELASEFRYRSPVLEPSSLVLSISQSGETADTLAAVRLAKAAGARVLSLCNVKNSSIDREAHAHLYMKCDVEVGVASTKAFTSTLTVLNMLALQLAKSKGHLDVEAEKKHVEALLAVPSQLETVLVHDKFFAEAASDLSGYKGYLYMGRGVSFPIALEGALKLKELAYMHAEGYAAGEMKHGPIALIDERMAVVVLCPRDDLYEKTISNLEEVRARGGKIISLGTESDERLKEVSVHYLPLPEVPWNISPILAAVPMQLLAYHVAVAKGHDVDQPRNLAKSVTVE